MNDVMLFFFGAALVWIGAEFLVRSAARLATSAGLSPLIIGLTVVAFGTSAPELVVSVGSAIGGRPDVAMGNVVGSNIFNVLFTLGVSALITPLVVSRHVVRRDAPLMVGVSVAVWAFSADGSIGRAEGILLLLGIGVYTGSLIRQARREPTKPEDRKPATPLDFVLLAASLGMLVIGARWMVEGAVAGATALGMSELVVGLTIIATGTSLPEVATSLAAAARGERDIAVGNVIGSNLFNLMAVLGSAAVVAPGGISVSRGALTFDLPVMTAVAAATLPVFFSGHRIARWEGAVFVFYYVAYTAWLILDAVDHPALDEFRFSMVAFALPLTAFTLAAITLRTLRRRATESSPAES